MHTSCHSLQCPTHSSPILNLLSRIACAMRKQTILSTWPDCCEHLLSKSVEQNTYITLYPICVVRHKAMAKSFLKTSLSSSSSSISFVLITFYIRGKIAINYIHIKNSGCFETWPTGDSMNQRVSGLSGSVTQIIQLSRSIKEVHYKAQKAVPQAQLVPFCPIAFCRPIRTIFFISIVRFSTGPDLCRKVS